MTASNTLDLIKAIPPVRSVFRIVRAGGLSLRRAWMERNAAFRAIGPAWPIALCVSVFALAILFTAQGREVLLVTAERPELLRLFVLALTFASIALMLTAMFVMSAKTRVLDAGLHEETQKGQARFAEDPIHSSSSLRTRTAFALGVALPLSVFWVLTRDPEPHQAWSELGRAAQATAVGVLFYLAALVLEHVLHRTLENIRDWRAKAQQSFASAHEERRRHEFNARTGTVRHAHDPRTETATLHDAIEDERRAEVARSAAWAAYCAGALLHWFFAPPMRWVIPAGVTMATFAMLGARDNAAILVTLSAMVAAYVFLYTRHNAMREVDTDRGRELVVDRRLQATHRGVSFSAVAVSLLLLWVGYWLPEIHRTLGPATVVVMGLFIVVNILTWFVRSALGPPPLDQPPPRARSASQAPAHLESALERSVAPLLRAADWVLRQVGGLMYGIGRFAEKLQGVVQPQRVLAFGVGCVVIDKLVLPALEGMNPSPGILGASLMVGVCFVLAFLLTLGLVHIVRPPGETLPKARNRLAAAWRFLSPPRERAVRFPSWVLLAPFLIAALGENHDVTRIPSTPDYPIISDVDRANAWIDAARREGFGSAAAPIPAIVVLAEGGGIRAASHSGQLLAQLDSLPGAGGASFFNRVYAISGVSGGAIGASAFLAGRADSHGLPDAEGPARVRAFLSEDLLTPLLAGLFASDFVSIFVPFNIIDRLMRAANPETGLTHSANANAPWQIPSRGDFFENAMSQAWREHGRSGSDFFVQPLEQVVGEAATPDVPGSPPRPLPVVMFSTFSADDGMLAAASNTIFEACPAPATPTFGVRLVTVQDCLAAREDGVWTLPLSTAAHVSARFPGSNPPGLIEAPSNNGDAAGKWDGWRQRRFVDGGYIDNSGAAAAAEAVQVLRRQARVRGVSVRVIVLHIFARAAESDAATRLARTGAFNEVAAPLSGFLQARERSGRLPTVALCQLLTPENADSDDCARLNEVRVFQRTQTSGPTCAEDPSAITAGGADWISAPLCVSSHEGQPRNYLLGWLMKPGSHRQIGADMNAIALGVLNAMSIAPPERVETAPPT